MKVGRKLMENAEAGRGPKQVAPSGFGTMLLFVQMTMEPELPQTDTSPEPDSSAPALDKQPKMRDVSLCPCKSRLPYGECCAPYHYGKALPQTAEQLMRSRYSAYFFGRIDYLVDTTHPDKKTPQTRADIVSLADEARWKFLTVLSSSKGQAGDRTGKVEFVAQYYRDGVLLEHHEKSRFRRSRGLWKYVDDRG